MKENTACHYDWQMTDGQGIEQTYLQTRQTLVYYVLWNVLDLLFQLCNNILPCVSVHEQWRNHLESRCCCLVTTQSCSSWWTVWEQPCTSRISILQIRPQCCRSELMGLQSSAMMWTLWGQAQGHLWEWFWHSDKRFAGVREMESLDGDYSYLSFIWSDGLTAIWTFPRSLPQCTVLPNLTRSF